MFTNLALPEVTSPGQSAQLRAALKVGHSAFCFPKSLPQVR